MSEIGDNIPDNTYDNEDSLIYDNTEEDNQEDSEEDDEDVLYDEQRILMLPFGGTEEIGMNMTMYHYNGYWIMVDCGAGFAGDAIPGVDIIVPNTEFIEEKIKDNLLGIIITHAHEDHCGGLRYLWSKLRCPIYATNFTANFIKRKNKDIPEEYINYVNIKEGLTLENFHIKFMELTHSVPEMQALAITVNKISGHKYRILHTGDWKIDEDPVVGKKFDEVELKKFTADQIDMMICDSTNVFTEGFSKSESTLYSSLNDIIGGCKKLVAVTLFASNIARLHTVSKIAINYNRKIAIVGRSLSDIVSVAHESGYLNDFHYLTPEEARNIPKDKLILICTGCQGDELASINKLANAMHPVFSLDEDDTVIFSSKIIPGNEKRIFSILNKFTKLGIRVITERNHNVHVSGHPYRGELKYMYDLIKPKAAIPVHGEHMHVKEHVKLVKSLGIKSMIVENGYVIWLDSYDGIPTKISSIDTSFLCVDGTILQDPEGLVIKCRKRLALAGIVCVFILVKRKDYSLVKTPYIVAPGLTTNRKLLEGIATSLAKGIKKMEQPVKNEIIRLARYEIKKSVKYTGKSGYLVEVCIDLIN